MPDDTAIGAALWLLTGTLPERVAWLTGNGFSGVSLLQSVMDAPPGEREEAARMMAEAGMNLTYHGNFNHRLLEGGRPDADFIKSMADDILWWNEKAGGVSSECFDPAHENTPTGKRFLMDTNVETHGRLNELLSGSGVRTGIENSFGGCGSFCSIEDFQEFLDAAPAPKPGMLLDVGHANIHIHSDGTYGEDDLGAFIAAIPFEILEVHVSDNRGEKDDHRGVGFGNLDLAAAIKALSDRELPAQVTVEVCLDIAAGHYAADITKPKETGSILVTRDAVALNLR